MTGLEEAVDIQAVEDDLATPVFLPIIREAVSEGAVGDSQDVSRGCSQHPSEQPSITAAKQVSVLVVVAPEMRNANGHPGSRCDRKDET
ncbi:hypothetical protein Asp14428_56980 [Actinoplanes sp. NBRC 14428]|nr:hypothetical protein Asp14428_56980 [Actinoplanes sp. NBRC 14428]